MQRTVLRAVAVALSILGAAAAPSPGAETKEDFARRTEWWQEGKFGMFIHWGVYAVPADSSKGTAEWYMNTHHVKPADYEKFPPQFNPTEFDARAWVKVAKAAGMKYIVITSKHHDGFAMFDSKVSDYTITKATPFKRDPMKELAEACKDEGIIFCFYHSIMDWHHPDYLPRRAWDPRPTDGASMDRYVDGYLKPQLKELLTGYGRIGILWFDGEWEPTWTQERGVDLYNYVRSLQPNIIINNRVGKGREGMAGTTKGAGAPGDYDTPEQNIPASALAGGRLWETCMTMNDTWGYSRTDEHWKSATDLTRKLIDIASKGGNFLLNVGPDEKGRIPQASLDRLASVGAWMKENGQSIYATTKSPWRRPTFDGRVTVKGNVVYLHVFTWPKEGVKLPGLKTTFRSATFLASGAPANAQAVIAPDKTITLVIAPPEKPDPVATVVAVTLAGAPVVDEARLTAAADGTIPLKAAEADIHGGTAKLEGDAGHDNIGYWVNKDDYISWDLEVADAGQYAVMLTYACADGDAGAEFSVGDAATKIAGKVTGTGGWSDFRTVHLGHLDLAAGRHALEVRATSMPKGAVMNLRQIVLVPEASR